MTWTRTDYFTYFTDGQSGTTHRTADQVWNFSYPGDGNRNYSIHVSGQNPQPGFAGQHNAFAKKHLLTLKGGKSEDLEGKLGKLHEHRRFDDFQEYTAHRHKIRARLSAGGQAQYPIDALGGKAMNLTAQGKVYENSSTLSVVICDWIDPQKLRYAFAKAIKGANPVTGNTYHDVVVSFGDAKCVLQHDFETNETEKTNGITISFYCHQKTSHQIVAHVVHCKG